MPDDPWDWDVDRMVKELCTEDRVWNSGSSSTFLRDPTELETIIRENEIDGFGVLTVLTDSTMDQMGFKSFREKKWLTRFKLQLQEMSPRYRRTLPHSLFPTHTYTRPEKRPLEESSSEMPDPKRAKIDLNSSVAGDAGTSVASPEAGLGEEPNSYVEPTPDPAVEPEFVMQDALDQVKPLKEPKRIAPTFVRPLASARERSVSPTAEQVKPGEVFIDENTGEKEMVPILQSEVSTTQPLQRSVSLPPAAEKVKPGEVFIDETGRKRMVPIFQSSISTTQPREGKSDAATAGSTKSSYTSQEELLSQGDLGKFKITVDQIFYGKVAGVEDIDDGSDTFQICGKHISSGRRIYVNSLLKRFLKQDNLTRVPKFSRNGKLYSAIIPYPLRLVPRHQQRSFTLLQKSEDGEVRAFKEIVSKWPELVIDSSKSSVVSNTGAPAAGSNEVSGIQLGSGTNLDYDELEARYANLPDDSLLPAFGDSGSEGEYDYETWKEMEEERLEKENGPLERPLLESRRRPITSQEVESAIDKAIAELVDKWQTVKLPKLDVKAWNIYRKYRNNQKSRKRQLKLEIAHLNDDRIPKQRQAIAGEVWTRVDQVHKQAIGSMEVTIFDREIILWEVGILKSETPPPKPDMIPRKVKKEMNLPEGEEMILSESEYDSGDELRDFLDDDDDMEDVPGEISDDDDSTDSTDSKEEGNVVPERHATPELSLAMRSNSPSDLLAGNGNDSTTEESTEDEIQLPADPSTPQSKKSKANVIDLTLLASSPDQPSTPRNHMEISSSVKSSRRHTDHIDLVTPQKDVKSSIAIKRSYTPIVISDSDSQRLMKVSTSNADQIPPYHETAKIAQLNYKKWEDLQDRHRLVITFLQNMTPYSERLLLIAEFQTDEGFLWEKCRNVLHGLHYNTKVPHMRITELVTIVKIIRLFKMYIECKYMQAFEQKHGEYTQFTAQQVSSVEVHENLFPKLREIVLRFVKDARLGDDGENGGFEAPEKNIVVLKVSQEGNGQDDSDDETVISKPRRRQSPYKKSSDDQETDDDIPRLKPPGKLSYKKARDSKAQLSDSGSDDDEGSNDDEGANDQEQELTPSHRKNKRKIIEDLEARKLREDHTQHNKDQQLRRQKLVAKLARLEDGPSDLTRRIINLSKHDYQDIIYIDEAIANKIKDHQLAGVRFMWEHIVSGKQMQGCLLAHTMGLGKTMQVITLLVAIARATQSEEPRVLNQIHERFRPTKALVLCPSSLVDNWEDELLMWDSEAVLHNPLKVTAKISIEARLRIIEQWHQSKDPSVLIIGYPMFSILLANNSKKLTDEVLATLRKQLLEGPSIIVADEAHHLKNPKSAISIFASQFKSKSRIAMTGSPLNNNIEEYHTMIDWVAPNFLGPIKEFRAKYLAPIESGLWFDSTRQDRRRSKKMLAVLIRDVAPKVNRANMSVLRDDLPPKKEFLIRVTLTDVQKELYRLYVRGMRDSKTLDLVQLTKEGHIAQTTLWSWLSMLSLLCNHPACFKEKLRGNAKADDSDEDNQVAGQVNNAIALTREHRSMKELLDGVGDIQDPTLSNKVLILSKILDESREKENKVLVFTQSIPTLSYLRGLFKATNRKFMVLQGDTEMSFRQNMVKNFNTGDTEIFLISTKAGGLGLNLYAANRVVIFDFKYNPTQEEQAIGRAYRIGQQNPVFVYRFVAAGTFESKVENRAVFKMQLASRVVDKEDPLAWAKRSAAEYLADPKDIPADDLTSFLEEDSVLDKLLNHPTTSSVIQSILKTDTFAEVDTEHLDAEDHKEIETMTRENALQRSNPKEYEKLRQARQREEIKQRARRDSGSINQSEAAFTNARAQYPARAAERTNPIVPQGFRPPSGFVLANQSPAENSNAASFFVPPSPSTFGRVPSGPRVIFHTRPSLGTPKPYKSLFPPTPRGMSNSGITSSRTHFPQNAAAASSRNSATSPTPLDEAIEQPSGVASPISAQTKAVQQTPKALVGSSEAVEKTLSAPASPKDVATSTSKQPAPEVSTQQKAASSKAPQNPATEAIASMDGSTDKKTSSPRGLLEKIRRNLFSNAKN